MQFFDIGGGNSLFGTVRLRGAKNAVLPLLAASILTEDKVILTDCPDISDVDNMLKILSTLGVKTERNGEEITISGKVTNCQIPETLAGEMRSSIFLLGSILATCGEAKVAYPGGCAIGSRPINIHIDGLKRLNIEVVESGGFIHCYADKIIGDDIFLSLPSVGATENLMLASVFCEGETILRNAAKEPEIVDLARFLNRMGAKVKGAGTSVIRIKGVKELKGAVYNPIPDRIVGGTVLTAVAACGGEVELLNCVPEHYFALASKLPKSSCTLKRFYDRIIITSTGGGECARNIDTSPYPGFPTDLQPQAMVLQTVSKGVSVIRENIFETRFHHAAELRKMGADITTSGSVAVITGGKLFGAEVEAADLRGGAGLVIAGLAAEGRTIVKNLSHIDRGYESLETLFASLGADIKRIDKQT